MHISKNKVRYLANIITVSRMICSVILFTVNPFSIKFFIIYTYCGISDMLDGTIARKTETSTELGSILDGLADLLFIVVFMIKILPLLNISELYWKWIKVIIFIKAINLIVGYMYYKKLIFFHSIANKVTGFMLFLLPFFMLKIGTNYLETIICLLATFSAIQESYFIQVEKLKKE